MSDDLIERLLDGVIMHDKRWSGDTHADLGGSVKVFETDRLMVKAAAEIKRLRAENERLRGALEKIATPEMKDGLVIRQIDRMASIARAALDGGGKE